MARKKYYTAKTFKPETILNADHVFVGDAGRSIVVKNVRSVKRFDKTGVHVGYKTMVRTRRYPNTFRNHRKAVKQIGFIK